MDALPLDAMGYTGSYKLVGGRPALDLVNTISWPGTGREHDWLTTAPNVRTWCQAMHLGRTDIGGGDIADIHDVRQVIRAVLRPVSSNHRPAIQAVDEFNSLLEGVLSRRRIDVVELTWKWDDPKVAVHVLDPVVLDAAELLTGEHHRLKHCPSCRWLFEDQTRNGGRRWCDMADCGSRAKSNRYYHRKKQLET